MPSSQHAQPPPDDTEPPPPPRRRDPRSPAAGHDGPRCDCGGCREAAAIYSEPRREYSREQREIDREIAAERARQRNPRAVA